MNNLSQRLERYRELNEKRTQGEWKRVIGHDCDFVEPLDVLPSPYNIVARIGEHTFDRSQCNHNAAFIASAPSMFSDLQTLHSLLVEAREALLANRNVIDDGVRWASSFANMGVHAEYNYARTKAADALIRINAVLEKE